MGYLALRIACRTGDRKTTLALPDIAKPDIAKEEIKGLDAATAGS